MTHAQLPSQPQGACGGIRHLAGVMSDYFAKRLITTAERPKVPEGV